MAARTNYFFLFFLIFVLKPWLTFVSEHGNSERILDALEMVKLLPTLKTLLTSTPKVSRDYECSLIWKWSSFSSFLFWFCCSCFLYLAPDCWCLFTGIVVYQLWSFEFSRERLQEREWCVIFFFFFFFFFEQLGWSPPGMLFYIWLFNFCTWTSTNSKTFFLIYFFIFVLFVCAIAYNLFICSYQKQW